MLDKAVPLPSDSNQRCWAFLFIVVIIVLHMCLFFILQMDGAKQRDPDETAQSAISHLSSYCLT